MKNFLFVVLLVLIIFEIIFVFPKQVENLAGSEDKKSRSNDSLGAVKSGESVGPTQKLSELHLIEGTNGAQDWELFADNAETGQGETAWKLQNVKVLFFSKGVVEFTVTGQQGSIDSNSKDLHISKEVVTVARNGYILKTENIEYSAKKREIRCPTEVHLTGPSDKHGDGLKMAGFGLLAQVDTAKIWIHRDIHATKLTTDSKLISIKSERAQFSGVGREVQFLGQVEIDYDEMKLWGDQADLRYGLQKDLFDFMNLQGNVKVTQGSREAFSERLDMNMLNHRYVFSGNPKLLQEGDELIGERIIFLDKGKRVKVDKVDAKGKGTTGAR